MADENKNETTKNKTEEKINEKTTHKGLKINFFSVIIKVLVVLLAINGVYYLPATIEKINKIFGIGFDDVSYGNISIDRYSDFKDTTNINDLIANLSDKVKDGDTKAMVNLSYCYFYEYGTPYNPQKGMRLLAKAAKKNDIMAIRDLAVILESQNKIEEAYKYYQKAAYAGDARAQLAFAKYHMTEDYVKYGIPQNYKTAFDFLKKAEKDNIPEVFKLLSDMYQDGKGVEKSSEKADEYYEKYLLASDD